MADELTHADGSTQRHDGSAIAVIGMGCRFAHAANVGDFWRNLEEGRDCLTYGDPRVTELGDGEKRVGAWGLAPDRMRFDVTALRMSEADAAVLDEQRGVLFETCVAAAADAGVDLSSVGRATAVYAGCARTRQMSYAPFNEVVHLDPSFTASHFSYLQDLWGESVMVDAACATGLVAVHLASQSLRAHTSDYAVAGAVAIPREDFGSYVYAPGSIHSPEGSCRPFDRRASGTVPGDGAGALLLRRLEDAIRDGNTIHAVIAGTAVNNDGRAKVGYVVPGVEGKIRVMQRALEAAHVAPTEVGFVEAHGVGIPLNDQIEATALAEAFGPLGPPIHLGSVKASIGHCDTAAGMAALIKAVLAVREGVLPATPNVEQSIEELDASRCELLPETIAWDADGLHRTAGVMSAGVGGTNAFAVLREFR